MIWKDPCFIFVVYTILDNRNLIRSDKNVVVVVCWFVLITVSSYFIYNCLSF